MLINVKGFIDRVHVNFDILVIFLKIILYVFFMRHKSAIRTVVIIPRF